MAEKVRYLFAEIPLRRCVAAGGVVPLDRRPKNRLHREADEHKRRDVGELVETNLGSPPGPLNYALDIAVWSGGPESIIETGSVLCARYGRRRSGSG
jgi:hypothetical protein